MQGGRGRRARKKGRGAKSYLEEAYLADIKDAGMPRPVREYRFHPVRRWKLDAIWHDVNLVVEIEGGTATKSGKSRHTTAEGYEKDCEKYNALQEWGVFSGRPVTLLRFTSSQVHDGTARETTRRVYKMLGGKTRRQGKRGRESGCQRTQKLTA